jgi:uncharacterized protein YndB with AHSA1/START domain
MTKESQKPKREMVTTRIFDAELELVWKAWTDPEYLMKWWGPNGFTSPSAMVDFREGGTSLVCMRAPISFGGQDMYTTWAYKKIVPLERIEFIENLADKNGNTLDPATLGLPPDFPIDTLTVITFKDLGNEKTELTVIKYHSMEGKMFEMAKMGFEQSLDKMALIFFKG